VSAVRVAPGVIRIEVGDRLYAASLACTLATTVALRDISLDHGREVRVRTEADYEAILPVLNGVDAWLAQVDGLPSATVHLDGHFAHLGLPKITTCLDGQSRSSEEQRQSDPD
jgi:hypothetical protein